MNSGEPIELGKEKHFYIGRAEGNDISINDCHISRRHAEIWWDGENFIVQDLDSYNGTFINGSKITSVRLTDGDRLDIGEHSSIYHEFEDRDELEIMLRHKKKKRNKQITQQISSIASTFPENSDFSGTLNTISITDLCQLLNVSKRNGKLIVKTSLGVSTSYFLNGEIVYSENGSQQGEDAILKLLQEKKGFFTFRSGEETENKNVEFPLAALMLEAARQADER
jgi:hypothetical protein